MAAITDTEIVIYILIIEKSSFRCKIAVMCMPPNHTNKSSTLAQVETCVVRQQAIIWANVDPDLRRNVASQGHNSSLK